MGKADSVEVFHISVEAWCSHYLASWVGQVLSCRPQVSGGHLQAEKTYNTKRKTSTFLWRLMCSHYLSSRAVARQVLSAQMSLTSVFGMGTGGPSSQSIRTISVSAFAVTFFGDPYRIRTDVNGVRGRCLNHLTNGPWCTFRDSNPGPTD